MKITLYPVNEALTCYYTTLHPSLEQAYYQTPECNLFSINGFKSMHLLSDGNLWLNHEFTDLIYTRYDKRTQDFYLYERQQGLLFTFKTSYETIAFLYNELLHVVESSNNKEKSNG